MRWPSLADARIRSKLGLILIIPVVAIVTLSVLRLGDASGHARDAQLVGNLTRLSAQTSRVAHEVHRERMAAAVLLTIPTATADAYKRQIRRTDDAVAAYNTQRRDIGSVPANISERLQRIDAQFGTLRGIRDAVTARKGISQSEALLRYGLIVNELASYRDSLSQVTTDARLADSLIAAAAFSRAKLLIGAEEAITYAALHGGRMDEQQYSAFLATLTGQQDAFVSFSIAAGPDLQAIVDLNIAGNAVQLADDITTELRRAIGTGATVVTAEQASSALGAVNDLMRLAEQGIDANIVAATATTAESVRRQVLIEAFILIVVIAFLIALAAGTARSMARKLRQLRDGAMSVANRRLAEAVTQLRDAQSLGERTPEQIAGEVPDTIGITSQDEIGEVAQAFHVVHREAVRIAAEQAVLRASVSAMFLNLARRSQTLVDRMIGQLDRIERSEEDPKRLGQLFQLDHLATRMRRNDENVLVLAGADTTPPRRDDAPLPDVLRAAQSEVELYERIEFGTVDDDLSIAAHAVNDVVRLLAELVDNATRFSPPNTSVVVEGRRLGDSGHIRIEDRGLGLTPHEVIEYNTRLAASPTVDLNTFRMMGLAVVGRLAHRHGIRVRMQENYGGGTVVELVLPTNVLILPANRQFAPTSGPSFSIGQRPTGQRVAFVADGRAANAALPGPPAGRSNGWPVTVTTRSAEPAPPPPPAETPESTADRWADLLPDATQELPTVASVVADDDTAELPIFREIEAAWFGGRAQSAARTSATANLAAPAVPRRPSQQAPAQPAATGYQTAEQRTVQPAAAQHQGSGLPQRGAPEPPPAAEDADVWRSRADSGWRAAAAALQPPVNDRTRSGLPKRQPRAQLVPGSVGTRPAEPTSRNPEDVRGRLSAYHRGVQRGRAASAEDATSSATEGYR